MKVSSCHGLAHNLYHPSLGLNNINNSHMVSCKNPLTLKKSTTFWANHISYSAQKMKGSGSFMVGCGSGSVVRELEKELEAEMEKKEGGESVMGRYRHKCGEGKGMVEMLECLEKEAIMGEDEGKDPMDYNRRAHIFAASSRIFQALKELNDKTL